MSKSRIGCYACFRTLDPRDKDLQYRTFVRCERCGAVYHAVCREEVELCYRCAERRFSPAQVSRPARLTGVVKRHAVAIQPSAVLDLDSGPEQAGKQVPSGVVEVLVYLSQVLWAIVVALLLVLIAVAIGSYAYRLMQLPIFSLQTILDAIIRTELPDPPIMIGAVTSGLVAASVFYSRPRQAGRRLSYLLAGVITVLVFNIWLLGLDPQRLISELDKIIRWHPEILYANGIATIAVVCLIPLHQGLALIKPAPKQNAPQWLRDLYGWTRLLVAGCSLAMVAVYLATDWVPDNLHQLRLSEVYRNNLPGAIAHLPLTTAGAIAMAILLAAALYWPPKFRQVKWRFGGLRLVIVLAGMVAIGLLYRTSLNPEGLLTALEWTGILMLLSVPVQRALS